MANHRSALKRIRQANTRRLRNRYYARTMRSSIRKFRALTNKEEAEQRFPKLVSMLDRMAGKKRIHKNKAANLKSKLAHHMASL